MSKVLLVKDESDFWDDCEDLTEQEFWKKYELKEMIEFEAEVQKDLYSPTTGLCIPACYIVLPSSNWIPFVGKSTQVLVLKPKKPEVKDEPTPSR